MTPLPNPPAIASIFDGFDWDVPPATARMLVELPFRFMCADATYQVTVDGCTIAVEVLGSLVETTADRRSVRSANGQARPRSPRNALLRPLQQR